MRRRLRLRDEGGVTLIEMIMVLAILGIVLGGVTTVFISGSRAELQVNNRFQAQEGSRLAMSAIRSDVHSACAAGVLNTASPFKALLTLSIPITDTSTTPPTPPIAKEQCGTINAANIAKVYWIVCTSPTVSTKFALYRSTTSNACPGTKLVADNLVNTLTGFSAFFATTTGQITVGETQTVDVDIPVSLKQGTAGVPFDLKEHLALSNTVFSAASGTACSVGVPCTSGPCLATATACYPPPIS